MPLNLAMLLHAKGLRLRLQISAACHVNHSHAHLSIYA
jgi:hypothetical protein